MKRAISLQTNEMDNEIQKQDAEGQGRDILSFVPLEGHPQWRIETPPMINEGDEGVYFVVESSLAAHTAERKYTDVAVSPSLNPPHGGICECHCPCLNDVDSWEWREGSTSGSGQTLVAGPNIFSSESDGSGSSDELIEADVEDSTLDGTAALPAIDKTREIVIDFSEFTSAESHSGIRATETNSVEGELLEKEIMDKTNKPPPF